MRAYRFLALGFALSVADRASAWSSEWSWSQANIRGIYEGVKIYRADFGVYPTTDAQSTWAEKLIDLGILTPEMCIDRSGRTLPSLDGTSYLYIPPTNLYADPEDPDAQPIVRWFGLNGVDNGGAGDDITAGWEVNDGYYFKSGRPLARMLGVVFGVGFVFVVIPGVIWWKPARPFRWTIVLAYLCFAAIVICPLTITPWSRLGDGAPKSIWKAAWATLGLLIAYWFGRAIKVEITRTRAARRVKRGCCVQCRYDLRGLSAEVCPECGRSVHFSVPRS